MCFTGATAAKDQNKKKGVTSWRLKLRNSVCNHLSSHFNIATMSSAEGNNLVIVVLDVINTFGSSLTSEHTLRETRVSCSNVREGVTG